MDRRTFIGATGAATVLPVGALSLPFNVTGLPDVPKGNNRCCIVMTRKEGREFVFPAYYLNAMPLEHEDCVCASAEIHDAAGGDGCPVTGWFYDESNFEYEHCYYAVSGEVVAWAPLPTVTAVKALIG